MKKSILLLLVAFLFLNIQTSNAQTEETLFGKTGLKLTGIWGATSTNLSKFSEDYGYFSGGFGVLEFNKDFLVGWGGYRLTNDILKANSNLKGMDFSYNGLIIGYAPGSHKVIHPKISALFGTGNISLTGEGKDKVGVIIPSVGFEVNIFRWFRFGLEGGYRFVTDTNFANAKDEDFSAPYGEAKFSFGISWGSKSRRNRNNSDDNWDFEDN